MLFYSQTKIVSRSFKLFLLKTEINIHIKIVRSILCSEVVTDCIFLVK